MTVRQAFAGLMPMPMNHAKSLVTIGSLTALTGEVLHPVQQMTVARNGHA